MKHITLYYREGGSDKVYEAAIEPSGNFFIVTCAYGRRGSTLQTGVKTKEPVDLATAEKIFAKLVKEKTDKGYTPGESGTLFEHTENAGKDSGIRPQLLNAIDSEEALRLVKDLSWCLQEKKDGRRLLIKYDGETPPRGINRRGLYVDLPKPIIEALGSIKCEYILDGECVGDVFHAFDLLVYGQDHRTWAYRERLKALWFLLSDGSHKHVIPVDTFYDVSSKSDALHALEKGAAEGVVFKNLSSRYEPGRPASGGTALKYKFTTTGSFIVVGMNKRRSIQLGLFPELRTCGNVTIPPNCEIPKPDSVVEVRYLYAFRDGALYQPVFLGMRDDVPRHECILGQLKFKQEGADDDGE